MTNIKATIKAKKSAMILENPVTMSQIVNNLLIRIGHLRMDQYFFPDLGSQRLSARMRTAMAPNTVFTVLSPFSRVDEAAENYSPRVL